MALKGQRGPDFVCITTDDDSVGNVQIGAVGDKISFYGGAVPVAKQAVGAMTTIGANTGTSGAGLSLIGDTSTVNQATNIMNDFAALQEDINAIKNALVAVGLMT